MQRSSKEVFLPSEIIVLSEAGLENNQLQLIAIRTSTEKR